MKIKSIIVAAVVALFATSSLSAKSLVIYFSRADENYGVGTITEGNIHQRNGNLNNQTALFLNRLFVQRAF